MRGSGARLVTTAIVPDSRFPFPQSLQKSGNSNREVHRLSRFRNHQTACSCLSTAVTMGTNIGPSSLGNTNRPDRAALRHMNRCCGLISCRRATSLATAPGAYDSATIRPFSSALQRRRRTTPTWISTRPRRSEASTISSTRQPYMRTDLLKSARTFPVACGSQGSVCVIHGASGWKGDPGDARMRGSRHAIQNEV